MKRTGAFIYYVCIEFTFRCKRCKYRTISDLTMYYNREK